jgi:hypothetical protein
VRQESEGLCWGCVFFTDRQRFHTLT